MQGINRGGREMERQGDRQRERKGRKGKERKGKKGKGKKGKAKEKRASYTLVLSRRSTKRS
jgi:hypothetical protein